MSQPSDTRVPDEDDYFGSVGESDMIDDRDPQSEDSNVLASSSAVNSTTMSTADPEQWTSAHYLPSLGIPQDSPPGSPLIFHDVISDTPDAQPPSHETPAPVTRSDPGLVSSEAHPPRPTLTSLVNTSISQFYDLVKRSRF